MQKNALAGAIGAGVNMAVLGQNPGEALRAAVIQTVTNTIGGVASNYICQMYAGKLLNPVTHKMLHGVVGAGTGWILRDNSQGAISGAMGAIMAEIGMELLVPDVQKLAHMAHLQGGVEGRDRILQEHLQRYSDMARLMAACAAGFAGQDAGIAAQTGGTAAQNNFFFVALMAAGVVWDLYDSYQVYDQEGGDVGAGVRHFGQNLAMQAAGGVAFKAGGKLLYKGYQRYRNASRGAANIAEKGNSRFFGRSGFELKNAQFQPHRNRATIINNRSYSGHALDQMENRGIPPSVVENALKVGQRCPSKEGTIKYFDTINKIKVIVNEQSGNVITVIRGDLK